MVVFIDEIGQLIEKTRKAHETGAIQGIIVITVSYDGTLQAVCSDNLSYLERIGLMEVAKQAVHAESLIIG